MNIWSILLIILGVVIIVLVVLYILGRRLQKKQAAQQEQIQAAKQTVSMLIIDKKRLKLKESGLPQIVIDQTPKMMRRAKLPIVKAKVGPKIMSLVAEESVYDLIPIKREIKAEVSGIYIVGIKGARGGVEHTEKKKGFFKKLRSKANDAMTQGGKTK